MARCCDGRQLQRRTDALRTRAWALEELTEQKFRDHVAHGEVLHLTDDHGKAVAILVKEVPPAEDATLRLALVTGIPRRPSIWSSRCAVPQTARDFVSDTQRVPGLSMTSGSHTSTLDTSFPTGRCTSWPATSTRPILPRWSIRMLSNCRIFPRR